MNMAVVGATVLLVAPLLDWWGFGYDRLRAPMVALGTAMVWFGGAIEAWKARTGRSIHTPWLVAGGAFIGAYVLSFVGARDRIGALERGVPLLAGMALFCGLARGWIPQRQISRLLCWVAAVAILLAIVGGIQRFVLEPAVPAVTTLGNTNYTGALAAILACVCLGSALSPERRQFRILSLIGALASVGLLAISNARGAMVGFAAGSVVMGILCVRRREGWKAAVCFLVVVLPCVLNAKRVRTILDVRDDTALVRFGLWKGSVALAREHAIMGCGVGQFQFAFPPYRDDEEFLISNRGMGANVVEAREPHSTALLILTEMGALGLAGFLGLLVVAGMAVWRYGQSSPSSGVDVVLVASGGLGSWIVSGVFNTLHGFAPFDIGVGMLLGLLASVEPVGPVSGRKAFMGILGMVACAGLGVLTLWGAIAQRQYWTITQSELSLEETVRGLQSVLRWREDFWPVRYQLGKLYARYGNRDAAAAEFRRILEVHPYSVATLNSLAECVPRDEAERLFRRAIDIEPNYWASHFNLGLLTERSGPLLRAIELHPDHGRSYYFLGVVSLSEGRREAAREWFRAAEVRGVVVAEELRKTHAELKTDPLFAEWFREDEAK